MPCPLFPSALINLFLYMYCLVITSFASVAPLAASIDSVILLNQSKDPYTGNDFHLNYFPETKTLSWSLLSNGHVITNMSSSLPKNVKFVSASEIFNADQIIVAGLLFNGNGFIHSLNSQGVVLWDVHLKAKIIDLDFSADGQFVLVTGLTNNNKPLSQTLSATNGEVVTTPLSYTSEGRFKRNLLQVDPNTTESSGNNLISKEEERAYMALEWVLGVIRLIEITLIVGGIITGVVGINKYLKDKKEEWQERIDSARQKELKIREEEKRQLRNVYKFDLAKDLFGLTMRSGLPDKDGVLNVFLLDRTNMDSSALDQVEFEKIEKDSLDNGMLLEYLNLNQIKATIFSAAKIGDLTTVNRLIILYHEYIKESDENGNTILHYVAGTSSLCDLRERKSQDLKDTVTFLVRMGANIEALNSDELTPVLLAVKVGNYVVFETLVRSRHPMSFRTRSLLAHMLARAYVSRFSFR